ncbi:TPA: hypothetical protein DDZ86_00570 [Candidatus Dependentiae bacterium]|nr:hypothetical protein [Candidatus Dependentiae bacterium]
MQKIIKTLCVGLIVWIGIPLYSNPDSIAVKKLLDNNLQNLISEASKQTPNHALIRKVIDDDLKTVHTFLRSGEFAQDKAVSSIPHLKALFSKKNLYDDLGWWLRNYDLSGKTWNYEDTSSNLTPDLGLKQEIPSIVFFTDAEFFFSIACMAKASPLIDYILENYGHYLSTETVLDALSHTATINYSDNAWIDTLLKKISAYPHVLSKTIDWGINVNALHYLVVVPFTIFNTDHTLNPNAPLALLKNQLPSLTLIMSSLADLITQQYPLFLENTGTLGLTPAHLLVLLLTEVAEKNQTTAHSRILGTGQKTYDAQELFLAVPTFIELLKKITTNHPVKLSKKQASSHQFSASLRNKLQQSGITKKAQSPLEFFTALTKNQKLDTQFISEVLTILKQPKITKPQKKTEGIASHGLIFVLDEFEATRTEPLATTPFLKAAIEADIVPIITTGSLMASLFKSYNFDFRKWLIFEIPTTKPALSDQNAQYAWSLQPLALYLLVPRSFQNLFALNTYSSPSTPPTKTTDLELVVGLKIDHLKLVPLKKQSEYVSFKNSLLKAYPTLAPIPEAYYYYLRIHLFSEVVLKALCKKTAPWESNVFTLPLDRLNSYKQSNRSKKEFEKEFPTPHWAFFLAGHGTPALEIPAIPKNTINVQQQLIKQFEQDTIKNETLITQAKNLLSQMINLAPRTFTGTIVSLETAPFIQLLDFFSTIATFVQILSCHSADISLYFILEDAIKKNLKDYSFTLVSSAIASARVSSLDPTHLDFNRYFLNLQTHIPTTEKDIESIISPANLLYHDLSENKTYEFNNVPLIKRPGQPWVRAAGLGGNIVSIEKILADKRTSELKIPSFFASRLKKQLPFDEATDFSTKPFYLLLYTDTLAFPLVFEKELKEMPTVLSMVMGSIETTCSKIEAPYLTISQVAEGFLRLPSLSSNKIFIIEKVIAQNNLFDSKDPKKLDFSTKKLPDKSYFKLKLINHAFSSHTGFSSRKIVVLYYDKNNILLNAVEAERSADPKTEKEKPWNALSWVPFDEESFNNEASYITIQSYFKGKTFLLPHTTFK